MKTRMLPHRSLTALFMLAASCAPEAKEPASPLPPSPLTATVPFPSAAPTTVAPVDDPRSRFDALETEALDAILKANPTFARQLGLHEYDAQVEDRSARGLAALTAQDEKYLSVLAAFDGARLSADQVLDRALITQFFQEQLFELVDLNQPAKRPQFYEPLFEINDYVDRPYAPVEERGRRLTLQEEGSAREAAHFYENVKLPLSKIVSEVAAKNLAGYATYLRTDVVKTFGKVGDADAQARFARANEALAKAALGISTWLKEQAIPHGDEGHILGRERYEKLLRVQEGVTSPLADFKRAGEDDLRKNKAAYEALVGTAKVGRPAAKDLLETARMMVTQARAFIVEKKIVSLASDDDAEVKETPPYARWNSASLEASGPFDKARSAFYYITLPDPSWPKKEQLEYVMPFGTLMTTTVHEVYPGHFVQGRWVEKAPTRAQKIFSSYSFVEGWAHYTEQMMFEEGFVPAVGARVGGDSAAIHLGQLSDALLRDCRYVVSMGIHTEGLSVEGATKRFMSDCHIDKAEAREQAIRGTFDPGYFAYTLGKLQILALRDEAKQKLGEKFVLQKFHDALLAHGSPAVTLIHDRVLAELE